MDEQTKIRELETKITQLESVRQKNTDSEDMLNHLWRERNSGGGTGARVSAYAGSAQTVNNSGWTAINFNTKDYDLKNEQSGNTFTASESGYYHITANVNLGSVGADYLGYVIILKNANIILDYQYFSPAAASNFGAKVSADAYLAAGDTIQIKASMGTTVSLSTSTGRGHTFICIHKI
jgi:hypothetical protein